MADIRIRLLHSKIIRSIADGGSLGLSVLGGFRCALAQGTACYRENRTRPEERHEASFHLREQRHHPWIAAGARQRPPRDNISRCRFGWTRY
jgi:hypothetical protein